MSNEPKWKLDASDAFTQHHRIEIFHVPTNKTVFFKAWIKSFSDSYASNWNSEDVFGRMDPIQTFQNTRRTISIEWDVVAGSLEEAKSNMGRCELLISMLYPSYSQNAKAATNATSLESPPYFRFKFANLISRKGGGGPVNVDGLFGTFSGFDYAPDFEAGSFTSGQDIYPQLVTLSTDFTVLHDFELGWMRSRVRSPGATFPWGAQKNMLEGTLDWGQDYIDSFFTSNPPSAQSDTTAGVAGNITKPGSQ